MPSAKAGAAFIGKNRFELKQMKSMEEGVSSADTKKELSAVFL
jgi:hypothetical protein